MEKNSASKNKDGKKSSLKNLRVPGWAAAVVIVLFIGVIALVFFFSKKDDQIPASTVVSTESDPKAIVVETLPQPVRGLRGDAGKNPFGTEALGAVTVTGIIMNSQGKSTVIVVLDGVSYIVNEGDTLSESAWIVKKVARDQVTFACEDSEKTVYLENGAGSSTSESKPESDPESSTESKPESNPESSTESNPESSTESKPESTTESQGSSQTESSGTSSENPTKMEESE